jgi:futalosine hydrolase
MRLLIVAATEGEVGPFIQKNAHFHWPCSVLITGVGMVATAYRLGSYLAKHPVDAVLNVGIAGSFEADLPAGSLVRVVSDSLSELGAENDQDFLSIDQMGFGRQQYAENAGGLEYLTTLSALRQVQGITVNTVHGNKQSIGRIRERLQPQVESMEGAAVFYCAGQMKIPCLQVRSISNRVETRNTANWNIALAVEKLNDWMSAFTEELFLREDS